VDGICVVTLDDGIASPREATLREKVKRLIAAGKNFVSDMETLDYIHSSNLGTLVAAHLSANLRALRDISLSALSCFEHFCKD
jgi:anti-anti-sigma regulatory factor